MALGHTSILLALVLGAAFVAFFETMEWPAGRRFFAELLVAMVLLFLMLGPGRLAAVLLLSPLAVAAVWISAGRIPMKWT